MQDSTREYYKKHTKPKLAELLALLKLDKTYFKAEGDFLYYEHEGNEIEVLDLVGGYGSLILGHNNPELLDYLIQLYRKKTAVHAQLSVRSGSALLSKKISDIITEKSGKDYVCTVLNSGAEAIEAAIKHSYLNYRNTISVFYKELEKAFVNIENYYSKYKVDFECTFNGKYYSSLPSFKRDVFRFNNNATTHNIQKLLASSKSFHGKTLGALSITSNPEFRKPFLSNEQLKTLFFDWNREEVENFINQNEYVLFLPKINTKGKILMRHIKQNCITAIIIEPILGEGGVYVVPYDFLKFLREKASLNNIPLIFDEIQCGFYRTGEFLASFKANVYADYYTMGKSLGGGLAKISALIISKDKYIPEFEMIHSSTFADDDISSLIALKSIEIASRYKDDIIKKGNDFKSKLKGLKVKYNGIITAIKGDGLMIGITFKDFSLSQCYGLQGLYRSNYFGYVLSSYLLNKHNIRVSVTLSETKTIRIHPSLFIEKFSIEKFTKAIDELCYILQCSDFYSLIEFTLDKNQQNLRPVQYFDIEDIILENEPKSISHVGFLVHYIDPSSIRESIPSLAVMSDNALYKLNALFMPFAQPVLLGRNCIESIQGEKILISFVGLPFISKMVREDLSDSRYKLSLYQKICNKAVDFLCQNGVSIIGLGQFTSIIMHNGKAINNSNVVVTTGNSFTVYTALKAVKAEINKRKSNQIKMAIIGAGGNIATVITSFLIDECDSILLVGSSENSKDKIIDHANYLLRHILRRLLNGKNSNSKIENVFLKSELLRAIRQNEQLLESNALWETYLKEFSADPPINISWELSLLKGYDIIVVATNQGDPFLESHHFKNGAFICDISVPSNCKQELIENRNIKVIRGGLVSLPNHEQLHAKGLTLEKGQAFACMSETMLIGFEQSKKPYSFGELLIGQVNEIGSIGELHGLTCYQDFP